MGGTPKSSIFIMTDFSMKTEPSMYRNLVHKLVQQYGNGSTMFLVAMEKLAKKPKPTQPPEKKHVQGTSCDEKMP